MVKIRLEITVNNLVKKKKSFFTIKKKTFWQSQKSLFSIGVNPCFRSKNANFVYVDLVKIRLEIMLVTSHRKKETFWTIKKTEFFKVEKIAFFSKGFNPAFWSKKPNSSLFRFGHNKTRKTASRLCREKRNLFWL